MKISDEIRKWCAAHDGTLCHCWIAKGCVDE